MRIKDKLGYSPLLIMDNSYSEHIYSVNRTVLPVVSEENFMIRRVFNARIADEILEKAHCLGFATLDVAPETYDINPETRVRRANANYSTYSRKYPGVPDNRLAIYIAFHYDPKACEWDDGDNLIKLYYEHGDGDSKELAYLVYHALITDHYQGVIKPAKEYILEQTVMCAIHIDASFMEIKDELFWMFEEDYIEDIADRILTGCLQYYGIRNMHEILQDNCCNHEDQIRELEKKIQVLEETIMELKNK